MSKYSKPLQRKHAGLIKEWANGAEIESIDEDSYLVIKIPTFSQLFDYRIKPTCDYALAKIAEIGGDDMTELYLYWLDGGEVEYEDIDGWKELASIGTPSVQNSPYNFFLLHLDMGIRKKERIIKQVLIIYCYSVDSADTPAVRRWHTEGDKLPYGWYKVPSMTREVRR